MASRIASFFSGVEGFGLGLERAGLGPVVFQCELDPCAISVLERHYPGVQRHGDIATLQAEDIPSADIWCGGPPCQDLSDAGARRDRPGLNGDRSGLAYEWLRLIEERLPGVVIWENVDGAAWRHWVPVVRRKLHQLGYSGLPLRVRASDVGAPFEGARIFIVALSAATYGDRESAFALHAQTLELPKPASSCWQDWGGPSSEALGMDDGLPGRMDRLRLLGNSVVPQCAEIVGRNVQEILNGL